MSDPRPVSAPEAVKRALSMVGNGGQYELGTGDYRPRVVGGMLIDRPWTDSGAQSGSDCAGFAISWCYKLQRHRPGYNTGAWATVSDDLNCNSVIEDAQHGCELFSLTIGMPQPGDLLTYPTIRIPGADGNILTFIGHVGMVVSNNRATTWDAQRPRYDLLDVAQCRGPNGRAPGVLLTDGSIWSHHAEQWPKPAHTVQVLRAVP